jgi:hypothetical protein
MIRRNKTVSIDPYIREYSMTTKSGHLVERGDTIKVSGENAVTFKFIQLSTNPNNQKTWVDCYELQKGLSGPQRSFEPDRIRAVKKRGKRAKRRDSIS